MFPSVKPEEGAAHPSLVSPSKRDNSKGSVSYNNNNSDQKYKSLKKLHAPSDHPQTQHWKKKKLQAMQLRLEVGNAQNNSRIVTLINQLAKTMEEESVPDSYAYFFFGYSKGIPLDRLQDILLKEIRSIHNKQSFYHESSKAIESRESCLSQLKLTLDDLKNARKNEQQQDRKLKLLTEEISHYRKLTLHIIDVIRRWKDWLFSFSENRQFQNPLFLYEDQNYLIKILSDTNFLATTILADYLVIATKNDPFIVRPLKEERTQINQKYLKAFECDEESRKKMVKCLEYLASEKAEELKHKINSKDYVQYPKKPGNAIVSDAESVIYPKKSAMMLIARQNREKKAVSLLPNYETDVEKIEQFRLIERERERIERLEKNQQRINAIKSIYESKQSKNKDGNPQPDTDNEVVLLSNKGVFSDSKRMMPQNSLQGNRSMPRLKPQQTEVPLRNKSISSVKKIPTIGVLKNETKEEDDFERLLRTKEVEILKEARGPTNRLKEKMAPKRLLEDKEGVKQLEKALRQSQPQPENKILTNVKGIESDIKSKIASLKEQSISTNMNLKHNEDLLKEMKAEILKKIERQNEERERVKKHQREEQQRMLDEMRAKLRKDFEDKIKEEKKKKQMEKEELERQLRQEEERLAAQRRIELELTAKLNREKDQIEIQRIRRETAEKEKQLRTLIQKEREEKLKLQEELNKRTLQSTLEEQVKHELELKIEREAKIEASAPRQLQLEKELELVRIKEAMELERLSKENQARDKLLKEKMEEEYRRKENIEKLMKQTMEKQKKEMENSLVNKQKQMEQQMRDQVKQEMLENLREEKAIAYERAKKDRERDIEQQVYREKIREKLEREMRIQVIQKTKQELQERELRKKQITAQLEEAEAQMTQKMLAQPIDKAKIEAEVKKDIIEKTLIDKRIQKEVAKNQLREQFQKELLGTLPPQIYSVKDDYQLKNIQMYRDNSYLDSKLQQHSPMPTLPALSDPKITSFAEPASLTRQKTIQVQASSSIIQPQPSEHASSIADLKNIPTLGSEGIVSPVKKAQGESRLSLGIESAIKVQMTEEQYQIYMKKKKNLEEMRDSRKKIVEPVQEQPAGYEKVSIPQLERDKRAKTIDKDTGNKAKTEQKERQQNRRKEKERAKRKEEDLRKALEKQEEELRRQVRRLKRKNSKKNRSESSESQQQVKKTRKESNTKRRTTTKKDDDSDSSEDKEQTRKRRNSKRSVQKDSEEEKPKRKTDGKKKKRSTSSEEEEDRQQQEQKARKKKNEKKQSHSKKNISEESEEQDIRKSKQKYKEPTRKKSISKMSQKGFDTSSAQEQYPARFSSKQKDSSKNAKQIKKKKQKSQSDSSSEKRSLDSESDSVQRQDKQYSSSGREQAFESAQRGLQNKDQKDSPQISKIDSLKTNNNNPQKINITIDAIEEGELDEYLGGHFIRLPKEQVDVLALKRQELYRKLVGEVTFSLLLGYEQGKALGLCLAYHDRSKHEHRKFVLAHIGTYRTDKLFEFLIQVCNYIFRKDPTDQIEFVYRYDESIQTQLEFSNKFNARFDKYGAIFQKKMPDRDTVFERKYVMKRPFHLKCEVKLAGANKQHFGNLFTVSASVLASNTDLVKIKEQSAGLSQITTPQNELSYSVLVSEIFRNCLSPDEAEGLKQKVKEYLKLKELLVLVVLLEKKKVKLSDVTLTEFKTLTELNMRLMSQGKEIIRVVKDPGVAHNRVFYCDLQQSFKLPFQFQTAALPLQHDGRTLHINYFRMAAIPPHKLHSIRSSLYNAELHVLPTENPNYKLFLMSASEYLELRETRSIDLFMYLRVFLKNVRGHQSANWKYVWVPEISTKGGYWVREYRSFLDKDFFAFDSVNISYRQFLPGALIIQPQHKDLVITPPFIVGILSVSLEQVSEGSPLYIRLLDVDALKVLETE